MELYVANATRQVQRFAYRVPTEVQRPKSAPSHQDIPVGAQIRVARNLDTIQIDGIIAQHRPYGLTAVEDVEKIKGVIPTIYSDRKIPAALIERVMRHNMNLIHALGKKTRQEIAVALNAQISGALKDMQAPSELRELEVSTQEDRKMHSEGDPEQISEATVVTRDVDERAGPTPAKGARRRRGNR